MTLHIKLKSLFLYLCLTQIFINGIIIRKGVTHQFNCKRCTKVGVLFWRPGTVVFWLVPVRCWYCVFGTVIGCSGPLTFVYFSFLHIPIDICLNRQSKLLYKFCSIYIAVLLPSKTNFFSKHTSDDLTIQCLLTHYSQLINLWSDYRDTQILSFVSGLHI